MRLKKTSLFILALLLTTVGLSQQSILDRFQARVHNGQVQLSWTIKKGSTCNGIGITRSIDSLTFIEIGHIEGICGDVSIPVNYSFSDINPIANRTNYYRLELGDVGTSDIISIQVIALDSRGYYAFPNPGIHGTRIYFDNPEQQRAELRLFTLNGGISSHVFTEQDYFDLDFTGFNAGLYLFLIYTNNTNPINGKVLVK